MDDKCNNYKLTNEIIRGLIEKKPDLIGNIKRIINLKIEKLNSISNTIYKVTIKENDTFIKNLLLKFYGNHDVSREFEENLIRKLSTKKLCPEILDSDCASYRIEEFLENYEDLSYNQIFDEKIIENLIPIFLDFNYILGDSIIPFNSLEDIKEANFFFPFLKKYHSKSINVIQKCVEVSKENPNFSMLKEKINHVKEFVYQFETILKNLFPGKLFLTLNHNDVHALNIMCKKESEEIKLLDYEYSCYNVFGFDICNYFIESFFNFTLKSFPFFALNTNSYYVLFDEPFFYNTYCKYVNLYFKRNQMGTKEEEHKYLLGKEYFYRVLCLGSIFWVMVAISNINLEDIINESGFNFLEYSNERLKIYELGISRLN